MVSKKGKGAKTKGSKPLAKKPQQENTKDLTQQSPQERVALVRPLWETLEQDERVKLLSIGLESVRARAKQLAETARQQAVADAPEGEPLDPALLELEPSIEDVLEEGVKRLKEKGTWKLWHWPADNVALYDAESFRQHITEKHIREELRRLLPRDEGRAMEKPAEAAFRQRMLDLLSKVQQSNSANSLRPSAAGASGEDGATRPYRRRGDPGSHLRDANIELLSVLLEALAKENDHLYHSLLTPITTYVMEILPEGHRETTKLELSFEDVENILPDDVTRIVDWLAEKVDALSTKLKPEPKEDEEEEENMGDVDLWSLSEEDNSLTVNARWLQHLQDRLLGEDGHPRRAKQGEDPGHNGLVLEWVYGSIVSTAEKARDGAKRCLGMSPSTAADAHMLLVRALDEHLAWETRAKQCKDLLSEMLKSRLEAAELNRQGYDLRPQPKRDLPGISGESGQGSAAPLLLEDGTMPGVGMGLSSESKPLPDEVILFMLRREALLTRAKLHYLVFEHLTQEKELRILKQALRQGEPEFERLKRELDEVKHQPRGMEGAYRSAAEMERHRHQLEVQTAFREQGARLQATYDKKQKAEFDMAKRETEIKQLQGWKGTVENLVDKFQELITCRNERVLAASAAGKESGATRDIFEVEGDLEAASGSLTPQQYIQLTKMRNHFTKDVRKQLYGEADDRTFFDNLKTALKAIERRLEDSSVALQHLEMQLINVACDDPGAIIGTQLALPLLQERLDQRGLEYAAQRAKLAEDEVLRMELLAAEREAAERERKKAAKAKKNEKAKSEKERLAAERQAKEAAERAARQEVERERAIRNEEERRKRMEAVEAMRKAEEAAMELRRKELLSDENGYWRQRMIMEERLSGMAAATGGNDRNITGVASSPDLSEEHDRNRSSSPEDAHRDDDEGFTTENRRRRHKDTRDQDEEVAAPAPVPVQAVAGLGTGSAGGRAHLRSGSRDRMGPRDGAPQRELGDNQHPQRDRESRRHQGPAGPPPHRSGSREGRGRQGAHSSGGGQHPQRPPCAPPSAPALPTIPAAASPALPVVVPPALPQVPEPVDTLELESAPLDERPAVMESMVAAAEHTNVSVEQPAAPASAGQSSAIPAAPETEGTAGSPAPSGALPSPGSGVVPEDAILFGDIAVIPVATVSAAVSMPAKVVIPEHTPATETEAEQPAVPLSSNDGRQALTQSTVSSQPPQQQLLGQAPPEATQLVPQQPSQPPGGPNVAAPVQQQQQSQPQQHVQASALPLPQQQLGPGPSIGVTMAPHNQAVPLGTIPTGQVVHPIGHLPPGGLNGPLPGIVPPMMAHMAPPGPGPHRPPGTALGPPPPPYMHVNGAIPVPLSPPGGTMPAMGPVLPKQLQGHQMQPPPPQGSVLVPMAAPQVARPPTPGPGIPAGPPPPPGMAGPPPLPQAAIQVGGQLPPQQQQPAGHMARPAAPMPGMPGPPGPPAGLVQVLHPPGPGQPQHGQSPGAPPGAGPRGGPGPQGQPPVMMAPMQFSAHIPGGGMPMPQPPTGPMGHVPAHVYVFPAGPAGMVPPPAGPAQLQPHSHPHMLQMVPTGMPMPMGPPPQMHMQPAPQQQQPAGQSVSAVASLGSQPPPPPKSPSAAGSSKPSSTLNANARSFVPAGKVAAAPGGGAAGAAGGQPQPHGGAAPASSAGSSQQHAQQQQNTGVRSYQRQGSGFTEGATVMAQQGQPPLASYTRVGPTGQFPSSSQPPVPGGSQYGGRRERRDGPRGGPGVGSLGPRKGPVTGHTGPHGMMPSPADMAGGPLAPSHPHSGAPPPIPLLGPGAPLMMVMGPAGPLQVPVHAPHVAHGRGMESADDGAGVSTAGQGSDSSAEDVGRLGAVETASVQSVVGMPGVPPVPPMPPASGPGPGSGPAPQHAVLPPPPHGMAPPGSRMMLTWGLGMPGAVQVPLMPVMPMGPMAMPMHMVHAVGGPHHGPNDGPVQKNGSAAESVRAPHAAQPLIATAATEADREGLSGGDDSAATATATAPNTQTNDGDLAETSHQDGGLQLPPAARQTSSADTEQWTVPAGRRGSEEGGGCAVDTDAQRNSTTVEAVVAPDAQIPGAISDDSTTGLCRALANSKSEQQQQRVTAAATGNFSTGLPCRTSGFGQTGLVMTTPSWSSVAARRDGSATSSTNGHSLDPFPSLLSGASSTSLTSGGDTQPGSAGGPSLHGASWKAKLQQNAPSAVASGSSCSASAHKSPSSGPNGVSGGSSPPIMRGASPRGTMNGSVGLAGNLPNSAAVNGSVSNSMGALAAVAAPPRPPGNPPTGSSLLSGAPTQLIGSISLAPPGANSGGGGVMYHPGVSGQPRKLRLVRGLQNLGGQHNCFLNVIIQSLWHLRSFRDAILQVDMDEMAARGAATADVTVLRALVSVFRTMAAPLTAATKAGASEGAVPSWVVSPLELREALSVLETGQAFVRLDLSEMHDAFEVLLVLLTCMHRAESGSGASQGQDPQLPRRVRLRDIAAAAAAAVQAPSAFVANGHCHPMPQAMGPTGYAAAVAGKTGKATAPAGSAAAVPCTAAHSLFGLEVLTCAAEEDGSSYANGSTGAVAGKDRQQQQQCNRHRRDSSGGAGPILEASAFPSTAASMAHAPQLSHHPHAGSRQYADDQAAAEVVLYTKYFHLVPAQALRKAFAALDASESGAYFEDVLCAAEATGASAGAGPLVLPIVNGRRLPAIVPSSYANGHATSHGWAPGATAAAHPLATLVRFPTVFTLALVWESLQAPLDALRGTLQALGPRVDMALLFRCSGALPGEPVTGAHPPSAPCELRSVICYFGHHYLVFALSEELGLWLMIDDANIQLVGHWSDAVKAMCAKRLQPSVLFYEAREKGREPRPGQA